uniref:Lipoprotein n=1 Tax=virus sp. ctML55 TaxID=2827627 RepID=A0A8S5RIH8_9VIRU|nr:MAG TPA: hypothetical protein [virus sp. ctML55]
MFLKSLSICSFSFYSCNSYFRTILGRNDSSFLYK